MQKTLIYGYGNPGREDDGLGARFIEQIEAWIKENKTEGVSTDCNYQLNIEDSALISEYDCVYFVDASVAEIDNYMLESIKPNDARIEFTMHAVSVAYVVDLCRKIYGREPEAYVLHIRGYEWGFAERLSPGAEKNLTEALDFLCNILKKKARP